MKKKAKKKTNQKDVEVITLGYLNDYFDRVIKQSKSRLKNLIVLLLIVLVVSCKKTATTPANNVPANSYATYKKGKITIYVESNYKYPFSGVSVGSTTLKMVNHGPANYDTPVSYSYTMKLTTPGVYFVNTQASKVYGDTTKYMNDNLPIWNKVRVFYNDTIEIKEYEHYKTYSDFHFNIQ